MNFKKNEGFTATERYLAQLCKKSFLSLWSYPSIFRDQGKTGSTSSDGKEVTDLLVVFDKHIIIFSDKDCEYKDYGSPVLNWRRWYKKAILKSAEQVWGAERWIKEHPERLFLDNKCQHRLPVELPPADEMQVHRIVVAHNVSPECRKKYGGTGSLKINTTILGNEHYDTPNDENIEPFFIGLIDPTKGYVHVFDDVSLVALLQNLDTISDFTQYLERKEKFINRNNYTVIAAGEDDLLAFYLMDIDEEERHDFIVDPDSTGIHLEEGFWEGFTNGTQYKRQQEEDQISYQWDRLIEYVTEHYLKDTMHYSSDKSFKAHESILRILAHESRLSRRMLAKAWIGLAEASSSSEEYRLRVYFSDTSPNVCYVFFLLNRRIVSDYNDYRSKRFHFLEVLCRVVKLRHNILGDGKKIIGIASEIGGVEKLNSFDVMLYEASNWDAGERELAEELYKNYPFLKSPTMTQGNESEYPE